LSFLIMMRATGLELNKDVPNIMFAAGRRE